MGSNSQGSGPTSLCPTHPRTPAPTPAHLLQHPCHHQQRGHHRAPPGVRAPIYTQLVLASFLERAQLREEVPSSSTDFVREGGPGSGSHTRSSCFLWGCTRPSPNAGSASGNPPRETTRRLRSGHPPAEHLLPPFKLSQETPNVTEFHPHRPGEPSGKYVHAFCMGRREESVDIHHPARS